MVTGDSGRLSSARIVLTVSNYNMHCGMDGWGRPYDYIEVIASFGNTVPGLSCFQVDPWLVDI